MNLVGELISEYLLLKRNTIFQFEFTAAKFRSCNAQPDIEYPVVNRCFLRVTDEQNGTTLA